MSGSEGRRGAPEISAHFLGRRRLLASSLSVSVLPLTSSGPSPVVGIDKNRAGAVLNNVI